MRTWGDWWVVRSGIIHGLRPSRHDLVAGPFDTYEEAKRSQQRAFADRGGNPRTEESKPLGKDS